MSQEGSAAGVSSHPCSHLWAWIPLLGPQIWVGSLLPGLLLGPVTLNATRVSHRHCLHHHSHVPVESVCHHRGQLPPTLHPQAPQAEAVPTQLLQALHLGPGHPGIFCWEALYTQRSCQTARVTAATSCASLLWPRSLLSCLNKPVTVPHWDCPRHREAKSRRQDM